MMNTLLFVAVGTPLIVALSLFAAMLVNSRWLKWRPVWRVALFAPYVTTLVATAVVWRYLLHTRYGLLNYLLSFFGIPPVDWLGSPTASLPAILLFVGRSEEHTSELQSLMRISYAVFCLKKKINILNEQMTTNLIHITIASTMNISSLSLQYK